ncbi:GGDEF domain-containing response regulator [Candidatus Magnetomonas plexicatena]|uniref:GGDEF domain-containing response regulator n=1 Tax=Candidatus Magnetomonas plexicatena TaxID=2552947 RepID=UPI001C761539|nr:diguanylate cyclase [Nitrospirales bacterium LBB_01]
MADKILIVDDNEKIRNMVRRHLSKDGYQILEAQSGQEALDVIKQNTDIPDVILLDVMMPGMTGFETCTELRKLTGGELLYIIMLTAVTEINKKVEGLDRGADDYVTKPFDMDELMARVRTGLRTAKGRRDAVTDSLTEIYNRSFFNTILSSEAALSIRHKRSLCLVFLDIDHFKRINDTYGHGGGDAVLKSIGTILKSLCRKSDIPVRWGGEEFAVLLPETDIGGGEKFAENIRKTVEAHDFEGVGRVTASLGVSILTTNEQDMIKAADTALYSAKNGGRNKVVCFEHNML